MSFAALSLESEKIIVTGNDLISQVYLKAEQVASHISNLRFLQFQIGLSKKGGITFANKCVASFQKGSTMATQRYSVN